LRKLVAALLAVPVLVPVYLALVLRRSAATRTGLVLGLCVALGLVTFGVVTPPGSTARPPTPIPTLASARFTNVLRSNQLPRGQVAIDFSGEMDAASVAAALTVDPPVAVDLAWSLDRTRVIVTPVSRWQPSTLYTITVGPTARDAAGAPLGSPVRASFLTRGATRGAVAAVGAKGAVVGPAATFTLSFDRPVDIASLRAELRVDPPVDGTLEAVGGTTEAEGDPPSAETLRFVPSAPLEPGTSYTVGLAEAATDVDGGPVLVSPLSVKVPAAPAVVRFRPLDRTQAVAPDAAVSVRFTRPMDRPATAAAFSVSVGGKPVTGSVRWAEGDTVLVLQPAKPFGPGVAVVAAVAQGARSADGVAIAATARSVFRTEKPAPKPIAATRPAATPKTTAKAAPAPVVKPIPRPSGSVTGSWHAVELYYLSLMNCTRTGGWVTSAGACSSPGGRDVAPLRLDAGISDRVSRPYAKLMLSTGVCSHFVDGNPGNRLSRAGYTSYRWAENIGCQSGDPYHSMLETHLFYQSEKSYGGGHYVNLMNPLYDRVGIGVWVENGRLRLVVDFYRP
jgi:uncharacterized protein YkwD